jgi:signal peptidase II
MAGMARPGLTVGAIAIAVLLVDQASKFWATTSFAPRRRVPLIEGILWVLPQRNSGGSLNLLTGYNALFLAVSLLAVGAVALLVARGYVAGRLGSAALGLIAGGALGNLVDRIRLGAVTDFLEVRGWPAVFNLADAAIRIGVVLLIAALLLQWRGPLARRPGRS